VWGSKRRNKEVVVVVVKSLLTGVEVVNTNGHRTVVVNAGRNPLGVII
jgi:hypothetical protein